MQKTDQITLPASDEMTLMDIWSVLVRHKVFVLALPMLTLLAAVVYLLVTPSVFESRAVIQVGQVGQVGRINQVGDELQVGQVIQILHLEVPAVLVRQLRERYRLDDMEAATSEIPRITDIRLDRRGANNVITLLAQDFSAEGAQKQLDDAVRPLFAEHAKLYKLAMDAQHRRLRSLDKRIHELDEQILRLTKLIETVRKRDPAQAAILTLEKGKLLLRAPDLQAEFDAMELAIADFQSFPTKLLREPALSTSQVKPRSRLIVMLALIGGVLAGVMSAFIAEIFNKTLQRLRERAIHDDPVR